MVPIACLETRLVYPHHGRERFTRFLDGRSALTDGREGAHAQVTIGLGIVVVEPDGSVASTLLGDLHRVAEASLELRVRVVGDPHGERSAPASLLVADVSLRREKDAAVIRQDVD